MAGVGLVPQVGVRVTGGSSRKWGTADLIQDDAQESLGKKGPGVGMWVWLTHEATASSSGAGAGGRAAGGPRNGPLGGRSVAARASATHRAA